MKKWIVLPLVVSFIIIGCSTLPEPEIETLFDIETEEIVASLITHLPIGSNILIFDITDLNGIITHFGRYMAEKLHVNMSTLREIKVVDRGGIELILKEQEFQMSGNVDPASAVKIGSLVGADYIIYGTVTELPTEIEVDMKVVSIEKGTIVGGVSHQIAKTRGVARLVGTIVKTEEQQQKELEAHRKAILKDIEEEEKRKRRELGRLEEEIKKKSIIIAEYEKRKEELQQKNNYITRIHREIDALNLSVIQKLKIGMTLQQIKTLLGTNNVHRDTSDVYVSGWYFLVFNGNVLGKIVKIGSTGILGVIDDSVGAKVTGVNIGKY